MIFSFECSHFMLLPACRPFSQGSAPSACQSVSSVFQRQRCRPILEPLCFAAVGPSVALEILSGEPSEPCAERGIGGSVVEFSPPMRETRVRFPASAVFLLLIPFPAQTFHSLVFACCTRKSDDVVVLATRSTKMRINSLRINSRRQS